MGSLFGITTVNDISLMFIVNLGINTWIVFGNVNPCSFFFTNKVTRYDSGQNLNNPGNLGGPTSQNASLLPGK